MKNMSWNEYYTGFYDWSLSTQKRYSYCLLNFGAPEEVLEVVYEFAFYDERFASAFVEKALNAGVRFLPEQVVEMTILIDKPVLSKAAKNAKGTFNREQLEEIYMLVDKAAFNYVAHKAKIDIFADDVPDADNSKDDESNNNESVPYKKKLGFFGSLFASLFAIAKTSESFNVKRTEHNVQYNADRAFEFSDGRRKVHDGRCNGDCANCPPHYGYRYGRWYYGHDHAHGCEFGGNKSSGSRD